MIYRNVIISPPPKWYVSCLWCNITICFLSKGKIKIIPLCLSAILGFIFHFYKYFDDCQDNVVNHKYVDLDNHYITFLYCPMPNHRLISMEEHNTCYLWWPTHTCAHTHRPVTRSLVLRLTIGALISCSAGPPPPFAVTHRGSRVCVSVCVSLSSDDFVCLSQHVSGCMHEGNIVYLYLCIFINLCVSVTSYVHSKTLVCVQDML